MAETLAPPAENPELACARYLLYQLGHAQTDVLAFGESTLTYVGHDESDRRSVADLIAEELDPLSTFVVAGPGYGMPLHNEYLRLAASAEARPVVVHSLWLRGTLPAFHRHPQYGHRRALDVLTAAAPEDIAGLVLPHEHPTAEEYAAYEQLPYPTILGERLVADFMDALRRRLKPGDPDHLRWMFEFHWGGTPEPEALRSFTEFGRTLRESGYRSVAFQNPVNIELGCQELGPEFAEWHARNEQMVLEAYLEGAGEDAVVLETGALWQPEDFVDDPTLEHLGSEARIRLAGLIADAVRTTLRSDVAAVA